MHLLACLSILSGRRGGRGVVDDLLDLRDLAEGLKAGLGSGLLHRGGPSPSRPKGNAARSSKLTLSKLMPEEGDQKSKHS